MPREFTVFYPKKRYPESICYIIKTGVKLEHPGLIDIFSTKFAT